MKEKIVDAVGFDLDNTLYPPSQEVNRKIQDYICKQAGRHLGRDYTTVREEFAQHYARLESGGRSLVALGIEEKLAREMVQTALEEADVASILQKDERLRGLLQKLQRRYQLFLITSSRERLAQEKLGALGVEEDLFYPRLYQESPYKRNDGSAFRYVSELLGHPLERMMFVGDRESVDVLPAAALGMKTAIVHAVSERATYQLGNIYALEEILLL